MATLQIAPYQHLLVWRNPVLVSLLYLGLKHLGEVIVAKGWDMELYAYYAAQGWRIQYNSSSY